jgi:hypothetical protein
VDIEGQKIKKQNGTPIADAESPAVASKSVSMKTKPGGKKTSGQPEVGRQRAYLAGALARGSMLLIVGKRVRDNRPGRVP